MNLQQTIDLYKIIYEIYAKTRWITLESSYIDEI